MNIRLFSINSGIVAKNMIIRAKIQARLRGYCDNNPTLEDFADFPSASQAIAQALSENPLVVIFASLGDYSNVKSLLIHSLHLKSEQSLDVLEKIRQHYPDVPLDAEATDKHSLFPVNADIFSCEDGIYSGFCCRAGKKYIMLLPFDADRTAQLLQGRVNTVLQKITGIKPPSEDLTIFYDTCKVLRAAHVSVAVANTATADFIKAPLAKSDSYTELFKFSRLGRRSCNENPVKFAAKLAATAAKECSAIMGAAMTNIFKMPAASGTELIVCIAVTYDGKSEVGYVKNKHGDDIENYLADAANELFAMIKSVVESEFSDSEGSERDFETF